MTGLQKQNKQQEVQLWSAGGISLQLSIQPAFFCPLDEKWVKEGIQHSRKLFLMSQECTPSASGKQPELAHSMYIQNTGKDTPQDNRCDSSRQGILNPALGLKTQSLQDMSGSLFLFSPAHQIDLVSFNNSRSFLESMCLFCVDSYFSTSIFHWALLL